MFGGGAGNIEEILLNRRLIDGVEVEDGKPGSSILTSLFLERMPDRPHQCRMITVLLYSSSY